MQPDGSQPPQIPQYPTVPQPDPFAFLNEQPKKRSRLAGLLNGKSLKQRIIIVAVGALCLVIVLAMLKSALSGGSGVDMNGMYTVLGQSQEIANLATIGQTSSQSVSYQNFSVTTLASVTTDSDNLSGLLSRNGIKLSTSKYILHPQLDSQLQQAAQQPPTFDQTYSSLMKQQLQTYQYDLTMVYDKSSSAVLKNYLKADYADTALLLRMLAQSNG